ncbi:hypothetical protein CY35_08G040700 [Sphagnum magellanicum]|nr:hypothetical protein CY35_08G040700 [Sphagnum magellanicum]KAH9553974.1 hypothetical protein CY35_08G040700 [Sphagnum magellanicum]
MMGKLYMTGKRMARFKILALVFAMVASSALGAFLIEENSITVTSPDSLKGTYQSSIGNFGVPQYGGTLAGTVVYLKDKPKGCDPFEDRTFRANSGGRPVFALVDRGDCYFTTKVYNAQQAGAAAVLVADSRTESLITMDSPEENPSTAKEVENINIPSALITKDFGDKLKSAIEHEELVNMKLDWRESLPHPDERVEYEFWTNSNDECGPKCDAQIEFVRSFKGVAQILERGQYTLFTPHYITWYCPKAFVESKQCKSQCINNGRYCAPDPEQDFNIGYDGKQVVTENLRQLCVFKVATQLTIPRPWVWWDYVTDFQIRCPMKEKKYGPECAEQVITSLSLNPSDIRECMGDLTVDEDNPILKAEQEAQVGKGDRGDVTILPTLVINQRQYRGKLEKAAVTKAICSGYKETTDPPVCLSQAVETDECLSNNGGCWHKGNITACKDTFRGRVCECPLVEGVQFEGDGYTDCQAKGLGRCNFDNNGCWKETQGGVIYSACQDSYTGCTCPEGFTGDGFVDGSGCTDIDECSEKTRCQCPECQCTNKWGGYDCQCSGGLLYIHEHDTCISKRITPSKVGWTVSVIVLVGMVVLAVGGYVIYKYRLRSYMDSEIRAIMAQYMPLDSQNEVHTHMQEDA